MTVDLRIISDSEDELSNLQKVFEECPQYFMNIGGSPASPGEARSAYEELPPNYSRDDKFLWGIYRNGILIGCIDVVRGYPSDSFAFIGLLLISERHQREGLGKIALNLAEQKIRTWHQVHQIRLAVVETNKIVIPFWERMGFTRTGEIKPFECGKIASYCILFSREI